EVSDVAVRFQAALTLGETVHPDRTKVLARIANRDVGNEWICAAALSSVADDAGVLFDLLSKDVEFIDSSQSETFLADVAEGVVDRNQAKQMDRICDFELRSEISRPLAFSVAGGLLRGADRSGSLATVRPKMKQTFALARWCAGESKVAEADRLPAIALL